MKKLLTVLFVLTTSNCFAMTDSEVVAKVKSFYEDRKELTVLSDQFKASVQALAIEYKVDECNAKRKIIMDGYQAQVDAIRQRMATTESTLGDK